MSDGLQYSFDVCFLNFCSKCVGKSGFLFHIFDLDSNTLSEVVVILILWLLR